MAEYLHPGVYVEEVSSGVRPIEGVGTSVAGFVGVTAKGIPNQATFLTTWDDFVRNFGYLIPGSYLPYAVSQFFANGGKQCYVVRVLNEASAVTAWVSLPDRETAGTRNVLKVSAKGAGAWGNSLLIRVNNGTNLPASEFKLTVYQGDLTHPVELFDNLSMDPSSQDYVETSINGASNFIQVKDLGAEVQPAFATVKTKNPLPDPVLLNAGETFTISMPDGSTQTVTFAASPARGAVLTALNNTLGPLNVTASLDANNLLVIQSNAAGFDKYFILGGTGTAAGRPLEFANAFAQGAGPAIPATLKSVPGPFNVPAGSVLNISVHGDALPVVNLTAGPAVTAAQAAADINKVLTAASNGFLATAGVEGNCVAIYTANRGLNDDALSVKGSGDAVFQFRRFDRTGASGDPVSGFGRSDPAFVQSTTGPFTLQDGSNFTITVNNGTLGVPVAITVNINASDYSNIQQATATELATVIGKATNAAGNITAQVVNNQVIVSQARLGRYYTLQITDGKNSPNVRLKFETALKRGFDEGDASSPYYRPGFNLDANSVNQPWQLVKGDDGAPVSNFDYIGTADLKSGLHAFDSINDVNFIAIPGNFSADVIGQAVGYCTTRGDCFFIADCPGKTTSDTPTTDPIHVQHFIQSSLTAKTSYGALYYPWMLISDPVGAGKNPTRYVPPSGFVAGMFARIDNKRGVWKAAAGTETNVFGPIGLEYSVSDSEQDVLNPYGVNCVRQFPASGIVIWGARTLSTQSDPEYRYVPVRRYAIYLERSIYVGTQWAVFEPNAQPLWNSLKANIEDFMMGEFRKGALAGDTPSQAFLVKCDASLNPPSEVNAGRVNMEVHFAPLKPAEFVIIRISQMVQVPTS